VWAGTKTLLFGSVKFFQKFKIQHSDQKRQMKKGRKWLRLLLIINIKFHQVYRLLPKSATLNYKVHVFNIFGKKRLWLPFQADFNFPNWNCDALCAKYSSRGSTSSRWPIVTMSLSSTVMEIWPFEVLPRRLFQEQRSVVGRSVGPQYYTAPELCN